MDAYSFKNVTVTVAGRIIEGFADGDDVAKANYKNDMFTLVVGADGDATRSQSSDESGLISIKLLLTSGDNAFLTGLHIADRLTGAGIVPLMVKSIDTGEIITAAQAWIVKNADVAYGKASTAREWTFETDKMVVV